MKDNVTIWNALLKAEQKARTTRLRRFLRHPVVYPSVLFYDYVIYPRTQKGMLKTVKTFFGIDMKTLLPSGTDILLHTIKAHDSEIRLAKFLALHLKKGDTFIDVGAHYGYYSLLAEALAGPYGQIFAIEPSVSSAMILQENTQAFGNITVLRSAASDKQGEVTFYEYPGPYAEANTTIKDAYSDKKWFAKIKQVENKVPTIVLDDLLTEKNISKATIKIDAEGGELAVLKGLESSLKEKNIQLVMEYLDSTDPGSPHKQALQFLSALGYHSYAIDPDGQIQKISDVDQYLKTAGLDSDNLVFKKSET